MEPIFTCRKLRRDDLEMVMYWRMSPEVTKYMNTDPVLTLESQEEWFERKSKEARGFFYWIVEVNSLPCGVINLADLDYENKRCETGCYIAVKSLRSFQLIVFLQMSLYDFVFDALKFNKVSAKVLCNNDAEMKLQKFCKSEEEGVLKEHVLKNGKFYDVSIQSMFADKWKEIREKIKYKRIAFEE